MDKYVKILKEKNVKITQQRIEIMRFLDENPGHHTVEDIYSVLKKTNPGLSKTTVYNSLEMLREQGLILVLTITGTEQRYESKHDWHHHLMCRRCGKIIDIDVECPKLKKMACGEHKIEEVHGYFIGICKDCLTDEDKKE